MISLQRIYKPTTFANGQIKNAFERIIIFLGIDKDKWTLNVDINHENGIEERKTLSWSDLRNILEINQNALSCLMFSYYPRMGGSTTISIYSKNDGALSVQCTTPDMDKTKSAVEILEKELRLEINEDCDVSEGMSHGPLYVDRSRIKELKNISTAQFDLSRLIRMLEELNACYIKQSYMSVITLSRAILDHVPPIFSCNSFSEVANNYPGSKSFKESMKHLENSSRKIADQYLHCQIRQKESLPNKTQVNFANDIDVLLSEIVRVLK